MSPALLWIIYYSDGATYSNLDGPWESAPSLGVKGSPSLDAQVILFRDPASKWSMRHGGDFFRLADDGSIVAMDETGMIDHVVNVLGIVKKGRMLTKDEFDVVYQRAKADMAILKSED